MRLTIEREERYPGKSNDVLLNFAVSVLLTFMAASESFECFEFPSQFADNLHKRKSKLLSKCIKRLNYIKMKQ